MDVEVDIATQLAEVENMLSLDPQSEEILAVKAQLLELLELCGHVDELQEETKSQPTQKQDPQPAPKQEPKQKTIEIVDLDLFDDLPEVVESKSTPAPPKYVSTPCFLIPRKLTSSKGVEFKRGTTFDPAAPNPKREYDDNGRSQVYLMEIPAGMSDLFCFEHLPVSKEQQ
jgi:hypothetical protein